MQPCTMWATEKSACSERKQVLKQQQGKLTLLGRQPIAPLTRQIKLVTNLIRTSLYSRLLLMFFTAGRIYFSWPTIVVDAHIW